MKNYNFPVAISLIFFLITSAVFSAQFLKIGIGARPVGMGEAFTGLSDDSYAIIYNPSGLSKISYLEQTFMHGIWLENIGINWASVVHRVTKVDTIGVGIEYLTSGDIETTNKYGNSLGFYDMSDLMCILSYAKKFRNISVGINIKTFQEKIENEKANGMALDIGMLFNLHKLQLGIAARNIGSGIKFRAVSAPLPLNIRLGGAYKILDKFLTTTDISFYSDNNKLNLHLGGEYTYYKIKNFIFNTRLGFNTTTIGCLGFLSGLSAGFGVYHSNTCIDYVWQPYDFFGSTHRISLTWKFDSKIKKIEIVGRKTESEIKNVEDMYKDVIQWYQKKILVENLSKNEQIIILKRIIEKFEPLGVDVSEVKSELK
ncbi:MAG: PorV/PorQ family protein [Elusimicrobiota bacterium]